MPTKVARNGSSSIASWNRSSDTAKLSPSPSIDSVSSDPPASYRPDGGRMSMTHPSGDVMTGSLRHQPQRTRLTFNVYYSILIS